MKNGIISWFVIHFLTLNLYSQIIEVKTDRIATDRLFLNGGSVIHPNSTSEILTHQEYKQNKNDISPIDSIESLMRIR
jgi:hypothetical protein